MVVKDPEIPYAASGDLSNLLLTCISKESFYLNKQSPSVKRVRQWGCHPLKSCREGAVGGPKHRCSGTQRYPQLLLFPFPFCGQQQQLCSKADVTTVTQGCWWQPGRSTVLFAFTEEGEKTVL